MASAEMDLIKHRDILFADAQPEELQGYSAAALLTGIEGILDVHPVSSSLIHISYQLMEISLEQIENALTEAGFNLSNRPIDHIKRALYYYTEETQRINNGCTRGECKCMRKIFINHHGQTNHGCRDPRPEHWREYL